MFIHSSIASSKAISVHSAIQFFIFQFPAFLLFLKVTQQLLTSSSSSLCHLYFFFYSFINNVFQNTVPTQDVTNAINLLFCCMQGTPFLLDSVYYLLISQTTDPTVSFSSTTFQNFLGISDLISEVSKFKHHTKYAQNLALYQFLTYF